MKPKPVVGSFYEDTWGQNVYVINHATAESMGRFIKRNFDYEYQGVEGFAGRCLRIPSKNGEQIVIGLHKWDRSPSTLGTLSHECFHAVEFILEERGMRHRPATSEAYAYLLGALVKNCIRVLDGKKTMHPIKTKKP